MTRQFCSCKADFVNIKLPVSHSCHWKSKIVAAKCKSITAKSVSANLHFAATTFCILQSRIVASTANTTYFQALSPATEQAGLRSQRFDLQSPVSQSSTALHPRSLLERGLVRLCPPPSWQENSGVEIGKSLRGSWWTAITLSNYKFWHEDIMTMTT